MKTLAQIQNEIAEHGLTYDREAAYQRAAYKAILNGDTFKQEPKPKRHRRRGKLPTSPLKIELRKEVYDRQSGLCFDCRERLLGRFILGHLTPRRESGSDRAHNRIALHHQCEIARNHRPEGDAGTKEEIDRLRAMIKMHDDMRKIS